MFKIAIIGLLASIGSVAVRAQNDNINVGTTQDEGSILLENLVDRCVIDYDPNVDYFPVKYQKPSISSYGDIDIFGEKFVPHNTTDFLEITYHKTYKIITNKHQDPPVSYLLYQCGTEIPQDVIDANDFEMVVSIPHKGGLALTQTTQIPYVEMLGLREEVIGYVGDSFYVTSPCLSYMLDDETIETVFDSNYNSTVQKQLTDDFIERNQDVIIFSGPTNNVAGDRVMVFSATQELTNVATFDWIGFFAALYNLEGESSRITSELQESYDCSSAVARDLSAPKRELQKEEEEEEEEEENQSVILWANYLTYDNIGWSVFGWSVAECPTWDSTYYCEYAAHCDAKILSRPEGVGYNKTYGSPTVYWYLNDTEFLQMAKNADVFIYTGSDFDEIYTLKNETMDQIKAVQNKQVFDTLGQGASAWYEQRYAEYDIVGLDMCDVVGRSSTTGPKHERRWFRNVYTEPIGSLGTCNVPDEISQPYVPPAEQCVRPQSSTMTQPGATIQSTEEDTSDSSASRKYFITFSFAIIAFVFVV
jgi:hypothetical protein